MRDQGALQVETRVDSEEYLDYRPGVSTQMIIVPLTTPGHRTMIGQTSGDAYIHADALGRRVP